MISGGFGQFGPQLISKCDSSTLRLIGEIVKYTGHGEAWSTFVTKGKCKKRAKNTQKIR